MKLLRHLETNNPRGYVALLSVIILGSVGSLLVFTLYTITINDVQNFNYKTKSYKTKYLGEACVEKAMEEIIATSDIVKDENIYFPEGVCAYSILGEGGGEKTILAVGIIDDTISRLFVVVNPSIRTSNSKLKIVSWKEVSN